MNSITTLQTFRPTLAAPAVSTTRKVLVTVAQVAHMCFSHFSHFTSEKVMCMSLCQAPTRSDVFGRPRTECGHLDNVKNQIIK